NYGTAIAATRIHVTLYPESLDNVLLVQPMYSDYIEDDVTDRDAIDNETRSTFGDRHSSESHSASATYRSGSAQTRSKSSIGSRSTTDVREEVHTHTHTHTHTHIDLHDHRAGQGYRIAATPYLQSQKGFSGS